NRYIGEVVSKACPGEAALVDLDTVEAAVLTVLLDDRLLEQPDLLPVRRYLDSAAPQDGSRPASGFDANLISDGADLRRVQLAARLAFLFQEYSFSRPEMIAAWRSYGTKEESKFAAL